MQESEFKAIYNEHGSNLYNFILWMTANRSIGEDVLQEVFIKLWRSQKRPSDPDELRRWLLTVTRNTCIDFFRKSSRFARFRNRYEEEWNTPVDDPDVPFLWGELKNLPELERSILYLHIKIGHTYKEIASICDLNENLVRVRAFRALKRLRESIAKKEI